MMIARKPEQPIPEEPVTMEIVTDPVDIAKARARRERFNGNSAWFQTIASEVYLKHRGKCICVAGQQLFVADTPQEARAAAAAAHPEDDGAFGRYIPEHRYVCIY